MHDWQTHVGYDDGAIVIRRLKGSIVQELIPRGIFEDSSIGLDLPYSLLENCFHWLYVRMLSSKCWADTSQEHQDL